MHSTTFAATLGALATFAVAAAPLQAQHEHHGAAGAEPHCQPMGSPEQLEGRPSPYDSVAVGIGESAGLLCYGRPSARGRTMIGGESVPFDRLWRTGANEPTTLHLAYPASIAGIDVEPGSYSIYTIPGESEWTLIVNAATDQWGHESRYTEEVAAREVGRATLTASRLEEHVETLTITAEPAGEDALTLALEWEHTRLEIPVRSR